MDKKREKTEHFQLKCIKKKKTYRGLQNIEVIYLLGIAQFHDVDISKRVYYNMQHENTILS